MSGTGTSGKFSQTSLGHSHPDTPQVVKTPEPPPLALRGDIWVETK
jgi:hypothetical protein